MSVTPTEMAELIADALNDAGLVPDNDVLFQKAVGIIEEELNARLALGGISTEKSEPSLWRLA